MSSITYLNLLVTYWPSKGDEIMRFQLPLFVENVKSKIKFVFCFFKNKFDGFFLNRYNQLCKIS